MKTLRILSFVLLSAFYGVYAQANDPVIMTINNNPIKKSEFEYIYNKNNSANSLDKKTLDEYVDLFVNFKLKVEEAKSQGLDTTKSFIREYNSYRSQLAKPYLTDKAAEEAIIQEAYDRMKEDVEISHILIRIPQTATAADTLEAWKKIKNIEKRLKKEDFGKVARETSEDPSAIDNDGYLGWISAFYVIYPIETATYNTPVGEISSPIRTNGGYHIIKVHNRRKSLGEVLVSHIMLFTSKDDEKKNKEVKQKIDSLYQLVINGENFGKLATEYSEDKGSAVKNGELPWFGTGRMVPEFEKASFELTTSGEISEPIQSAYGWHIIKLLDKRGIAPFEEAKSDIERKIKRDERASYGESNFVEKLKKEYNLTIENKNVQEFITLLEGKDLTDSIYISETSKLNKPLFSFANKKYTQADFNEFIRANEFTTKKIPSEIINEKLNNFINKELLAYEDTQLGNKYEDFKFLSQEYHDGILLFEISNQEVWEKASIDTAGLHSFFEKNKIEYSWDKPHYKGRIIYAKDKPTLKAAKTIVKNSDNDSIEKYLHTRLNDSTLYVKVEKEKIYVKGDNPIVDQKIFKAKNKYTLPEDFPYVFLVGKNLGTTPESYMDVRGPVTSDYQNYLEQEWIKLLRAKYPVVINKEVLKTVKQN